MRGMGTARENSAPPNAMTRLVEQFARLPGIGRRSAQRLAFHLLKAPPREAEDLAAAILGLTRNVRHCTVCFNLCESQHCSICADPQRDQGLVLVVEQPNDVATLEAMGLYKGVYHVLMGRLSALDGVGPGELNVDALLRRVEAGTIREVVLGTNPTLEGDGTALYLSQELVRRGVQVSRLARGLPTGTQLEQVSKAVLADALEGRQAMQG